MGNAAFQLKVSRIYLGHRIHYIGAPDRIGLPAVGLSSTFGLLGSNLRTLPSEDSTRPRGKVPA